MAGQACNALVAIDWSKYCHGLVSVDPAARTCVVEPGIGQHGLPLRPDRPAQPTTPAWPG